MTKTYQEYFNYILNALDKINAFLTSWFLDKIQSHIPMKVNNSYT